MIQCRSEIAARVGGSRPLLLAVLLVGVILALISAVRFQAPELLGQQKLLTDFDAFYIAGHLAAEGRVSDAYHMVTMLVAQREIAGTASFMPWTYPPPFTLLMQGLTALPIGFAFLLFALSSLAFYLWVLRRIAGPWLPSVVIAIAPVIFLNLRTGQNGFFIAGLIGAFLLSFRDNSRISGMPLGLLVLKPHLGIGVGLMTLMHRRWSVLLSAASLVFALLTVSTIIYGVGIWGDFRGAVAEASEFLASGYYPMFRMNSIYACAHSMGAPAALAMALQILSAFSALGTLAYACLRGLAYDRLAALSCAASICVSPYGYDYDLTILGVGFAFIVSEILERASTLQYMSLNIVSWVACGYGIAWTTAADYGKPDNGFTLDASNEGLSLIALILALLFWLVYRIFAFPPAHEQTD